MPTAGEATAARRRRRRRRRGWEAMVDDGTPVCYLFSV
jgi:hypothetical protein